MKVFTFWEGKKPIYIDLCIETWKKNIPNIDLHIINHQNIGDYLDTGWDIDTIKKCSYAHQSDIISTAVIGRFGGLKLDADMLLTEKFTRFIHSLSSEKLVMFGNPEQRTGTGAFFYSQNTGHNVLKACEKRLKEKIAFYKKMMEGNLVSQIKNVFHTQEYLERKEKKRGYL